MISPIWAIEGSWALRVSGHVGWPPVWETWSSINLVGLSVVLNVLVMAGDNFWVFGDIAWLEPVISWSVAWEVHSGTVWHDGVVTASLASHWVGLWVHVSTEVIFHEVFVESTWFMWVNGVVVHIWVRFKFHVVARAGLGVVRVHAESSIESRVPLEKNAIS